MRRLRIIRTLGKGIVEVDTLQGVAQTIASPCDLLTSSHFGMALNRPHVAPARFWVVAWAVGGAEVRWSVAGQVWWSPG